MGEIEQKYVPQPIDCSDVELSQDVQELMEMIAKNVHEVWSANRLSEGWTYGEVRDQIAKKTPCLLPYEDLPEEEKAYDRNTAQATLKLILKLGYRIEK